MTQHDDNPAAKLREGAEPVAWWVHDFHVARQPVKARGKFEEPTEYLYPASREEHAREAARIMGGTCTPLYLHPTEQTDARSGVRVALEKLERYVALYCFDVWSPEDHEKSPVLNALLDQTRRILSALSPAAPEGRETDVASIVPDRCTGSSLVFSEGVLHVNKDGSGYIVVDEDHWSLEDDRCEGPDGPEGSVHWITRFPPGEMQSLKDFLNGVHLSRPTERAVTEAWQPIETAPRDGTTVLLFAPGWESPKTGWTYGGDSWQDAPFSSSRTDYEPTHWMPLPPLPALALEGK